MSFKPHFHQPRDRKFLDNDTDYETIGVRKTHDMCHTISGFDIHI